MLRGSDAPDPTCWHEAGHAAIAYACGARVLEVSLEGDDEEVGGTTRVLWGADGRPRDPIHELRASLAGPVVETLYRGEGPVERAAEQAAERLGARVSAWASAWAGDWRDAQAALARASHDPRTQRRLLRETLDGLHAFCADPRTWERIACLADTLHAHETLDEALVADALIDLEWAP